MKRSHPMADPCSMLLNRFDRERVYAYNAQHLVKLSIYTLMYTSTRA